MPTLLTYITAGLTESLASSFMTLLPSQSRLARSSAQLFKLDNFVTFFSLHSVFLLLFFCKHKLTRQTNTKVRSDSEKRVCCATQTKSNLFWPWKYDHFCTLSNIYTGICPKASPVRSPSTNSIFWPFIIVGVRLWYKSHNGDVGRYQNDKMRNKSVKRQARTVHSLNWAVSVR